MISSMPTLRVNSGLLLQFCRITESGGLSAILLAVWSERELCLFSLAAKMNTFQSERMQFMKQLLTATMLLLTSVLPAYARNEQPREAITPTSDSSQQTPDAGITATRVLGEVTQIDGSGKKVVVKTEAGSIVIVTIDEKTEFLRVPPGETALDKAIKTTLAELGVGDKVYARGRVSEDRKSVPAQKLVVMAQADIQKKHERERAEWRKRGISGIVSAVNPQAKEITVQSRGREGVKPVIIAAPENTVFHRYAPDSVKFSEAKEGSLAELKVGDQLRALGEKSADGTHFAAEQVVSGSFRTVGGTVKAVSAETHEIKIEVLGSKQQLTVVINSDSMMRHIPPQIAMFIGRAAQGGMPGSAGGPGVATPGGGPGASGMRPMPQGGDGPRPAPQGGPGGPGGAPGPQRAGMEGGGDFQDMLERMPVLTLADIKPGDVLAVSSTIGADATRLTAITLVTGVEVVLAAMQSPGAMRREPNLSTGLPAGVLDMGISRP